MYENAQNVHLEEIEKSLLDVIEYFYNTQQPKVVNSYTYDSVKKEIDKYFETNIYNLNKEAIYISLNRIYLDRAVYSKYNCSLTTILVRLWVYIQSQTSDDIKTEMFKRLLEELVDMSGTCSTGYISRLINTITGFDDNFGIRISFEDQLISNFSASIQKSISNIPNTWCNSPLKDELALFVLRYIYLECKEAINIDIKKVFDIKFLSNKLLEIVDNYDVYILDLIKTLKEASLYNSNFIEDYTSIIDYYYKNIMSVDDTLNIVQDIILEEISNNKIKPYQRTFFNLFIIKALPSIKESLFVEFKDHITPSDFDLYIQKALLMYEIKI